MSNEGRFAIEEADIVRLESNGEATIRWGWVNVGTHAVLIKLAETGDLEVEVNARTNEGGSLRNLVVTLEESVKAGGIDPD